MEEATITRKGQLTIPKSIRERLGLKKGRKVQLELRGKKVVMFPEIEDPLREMRKLKDEVRFSQEEIQSMIESSKEKWSKLD